MLQEGIDEYIASLSMNEQGHGGSNPNTIVAYRNDLNQACAYLQRLHIENWQQVTREDIAHYLLEMREAQAYRPATIARKLASLKTFFRYLRSIGVLAVDPIENLGVPRVQKDLPQVLTQEQIACLFRQVAVDTPVGIRDLAMLQMLYATGMRVRGAAGKTSVSCPSRRWRWRRRSAISRQRGSAWCCAIRASRRSLSTIMESG